MKFDLRKLIFLVLGLNGLAGFIQPAAAAACESRAFAGGDFVVCTAASSGLNLQLVWRDESGQPYRNFANLAKAVSAKGRELVFAMNAGMYSDTFAPIGLYVEGGRQLRPVNVSSRNGRSGVVPNFYRKPNGIFFVDQNGAHIMSTDSFLARQSKAGKMALRLATQSGPMLVIEGALHPALIRGSEDRTRRSGVGVCAGGNLRFAISEGEVNFYDFALLFRDELQCPNALFLDGGNGAGLYDRDLKRNDRSWHGGYGPMFVLTDPQ